ncbi:MAG: GatB/YqeY domain-containing protein [Actinomycetota bacterium]|nr:GatB/YqeY domain-containing protein [Actinomycetota bacterium]
MNKEFIAEEIKNAMRARDKVRLAILRLVKNDIEVKEKDSGEELSDAQVLVAFKKVLKQTGETLEASQKAGTDDERTASLQERVDILSSYLPKQVEGDELLAILDRVMAEGGFSEKRDMGKAIGLVVAEVIGNCDKAAVAKIVGSKLA